MSFKVALIGGLLIAASQAGGLNFNTDDCKTQKYDTWDALYCPCNGGSGNYQYQYSQLPQGWFANKDRIYAPKGRIQGSSIYGARVQVNDRSNNQSIKRSLLFHYDQTSNLAKVFDADYQFDYDNRSNVDQFINNRYRSGQTFTQQNSFRPDLPSNVVVRNDITQFDYQIAPRIIPQIVGPQVVATQVINNSFDPFRGNIVNTNIRPNDRDDDDRRRHNPYYDRFPSDEQIDKIIQSADVQKIKILISNVAQNKLQCKSRSKFLQKLQSKIQDNINIFRTVAQKNRQQNFEIQNQITELQKTQPRHNQRDVDDLNEKIRVYRQQIDQYDRERKNYQDDCDGSQTYISRCRADREAIKNDADRTREMYQRERDKIRNYDISIAQLERRLQDLKNDRDQSARICDSHQRKIDDCNRQMNDFDSKVKIHQDKLNQCRSKPRYSASYIDDLNKKIGECHRQIDGYSQSSEGSRRENENKIIALQQKIAANTRQAERTTALFTQIENRQGQFNDLINQQYYGCYQYLPIKGNDKDNKGTPPSAALITYLKEVFGQAPNENIRSRFSGNVSLKNCNIFSPTWIKVYGIPYTAGYGSNLDVSQDQFKCTQSGDLLKVFSGQITEVTKNMIEVRTNLGESYKVHLGGCTKIQTISEQDLPQKGQYIYFKGIERKNKNQYNGYHVTCY